MDRRTFVKTFTAGVIGSSLCGPVDVFSQTAGDAVKLSVVKGTDPAGITAKAIAELGGMSRFVSRGDIVVVKPNMSWDRVPEQAANTNPEVVAEVIRQAFEAGAKKVKLFDNTCNSSRRCYKRSGIAEAAGNAGADVFFTEERKFKKTNMGGEVIKDWPVYEDALEADKIINVAIAKHHTLARVTLSMKNLMGMMGGSRNLLHQKIDINIADMAAFFKPTLVVLDAVRVLTANGPQGGVLKDVKTLNTVAASADQVAIDAFGATFFDMKGEDLRYVREAHSRGLGEMDLTKIHVVEHELS